MAPARRISQLSTAARSSAMRPARDAATIHTKKAIDAAIAAGSGEREEKRKPAAFATKPPVMKMARARAARRTAATNDAPRNREINAARKGTARPQGHGAPCPYRLLFRNRPVVDL